MHSLILLWFTPPAQPFLITIASRMMFLILIQVSPFIVLDVTVTSFPTCASISCLTFVKLLPPLSTTVLPLIGKVSPLPTHDLSTNINSWVYRTFEHVQHDLDLYLPLIFLVGVILKYCVHCLPPKLGNPLFGTVCPGILPRFDFTTVLVLPVPLAAFGAFCIATGLVLFNGVF